MAEVDLKLEELSVPELISAGARLADGLTNNPHFPTPEPAADGTSASPCTLPIAPAAERW